jgi:ADP-heptose:LPS heptosyltransferase
MFFQPTNDLFELCEQVALCDAVVSVDTAIVHVASGLRKPLLALYTGGGPHTGNFKSWHANSPLALCQFIRMGSEAAFSLDEAVHLRTGLEEIVDFN